MLYQKVREVYQIEVRDNFETKKILVSKEAVDHMYINYNRYAFLVDEGITYINHIPSNMAWAKVDSNYSFFKLFKVSYEMDSISGAVSFWSFHEWLENGGRNEFFK